MQQQTVGACGRRRAPGGVPVQQPRTFRTLRPGRAARRHWRLSAGGTAVARVATGGSWTPVATVLEEQGLALVGGGAAHRTAVPGRTTAVTDAPWSARLLRHGRLRPSCLPDRRRRRAAPRERRARTRLRRARVRDRARLVTRLHTTLAGAQRKRAAVVTDRTGAAGTPIRTALRRGAAEAGVRAARAAVPVQRRPRLARAAARLGRRTGPRHCVGARPRERRAAWDAQVAAGALAVAQARAPQAALRARRAAMPGIGARTAAGIVAARGRDGGRCPSAPPRAAWAGRAPANQARAPAPAGGHAAGQPLAQDGAPGRGWGGGPPHGPLSGPPVPPLCCTHGAPARRGGGGPDPAADQRSQAHPRHRRHRSRGRRLRPAGGRGRHPPAGGPAASTRPRRHPPPTFTPPILRGGRLMTSTPTLRLRPRSPPTTFMGAPRRIPVDDATGTGIGGGATYRDPSLRSG